LDRLLERIGDEPRRRSSRSNTPLRPLSRAHSILPANDASEAPVMIIRDLAAEAGAQSPDMIRVGSQGVLSDDIITGGLLSFEDAVSLLAMYVLSREIIRVLGAGVGHKLEDCHIAQCPETLTFSMLFATRNWAMILLQTSVSYLTQIHRISFIVCTFLVRDQLISKSSVSKNITADGLRSIPLGARKLSSQRSENLLCSYVPVL
jgi:hypothetical protein